MRADKGMKRGVQVSRQSRRGIDWHKLWQTPERAAYLVMSSLALAFSAHKLATTAKWDPRLALVFSAGQVAFFSVMLSVRHKRQEANR